MALKMKEDSDEIKEQEEGLDGSFDKGNPNGFVDMSDPTLTENKNPYVIHSTYVPEQKSSPEVKIAVIAVVVLAFLIVGFVVYKNIFATRDLTDCVKMSEDELASKFKLKFEDNDVMVKKVPRYTNAKVSVKHADGLLVVYANGKKVGLHTDAKRYTMFNVKIGDPAYQSDKNMTFTHDEMFSVLNDMDTGSSTTDYYPNYKTNECLVLTVNDNSGRVVAITYYSDLKTMIENLTFN